LVSKTRITRLIETTSRALLAFDAFVDSSMFNARRTVLSLLQTIDAASDRLHLSGGPRVLVEFESLVKRREDPRLTDLDYSAARTVRDLLGEHTAKNVDLICLVRGPRAPARASTRPPRPRPAGQSN
jgi:hypothetical protein